MQSLNYSDYLPPVKTESFFIAPTDSIEVSDIISFLKQDKNDWPNSIPIRNLKVWNKDICPNDILAPPIFLPLEYFLQFWKGVKLYQYTKKAKSYNAQTIDQCLYSLTLGKF